MRTTWVEIIKLGRSVIVFGNVDGVGGIGRLSVGSLEDAGHEYASGNGPFGTPVIKHCVWVLVVRERYMGSKHD